MTGWVETNWRDRATALHPGVQTAAVFAAAALLTVPIPNGVVEAAVTAVGLPALLPPTEPPIGYAGRAVLSVAAGLLAALLFATIQWLRERRANAEPAQSAAHDDDDPLAVRPLAATLELGARFDDSPYLAPPPPTPDARLDPDSTMGDPRWQVPGEDGGEEEDAPVLIERGTAWDREAPEPEEEWNAEPPTVDDRPQPGNAAEQWDGEERRLGDAADRTEPERRLRAVEEDSEIEAPALTESPETDPQPAQPSPPVMISVEDGALPSTDELLDRLTRAAERRPNPAEAPRSPTDGLGNAAAELAHALAALRG